MQQVLQFAGFGLMTGALLSIPAMSMSLMYSSARVLNLAFGEWLTLSAFLTWSLSTRMPLWAAAPLVVAGMAVGGALLYRVAFAPVIERDDMVRLITSLGLMFVLQSIVVAVWGTSSRTLPTPDWLNKGIELGPFRATPLLLLAVVVAAVVCVAMVVLMRSGLGLAIRATTESRELARVGGVNVGRTVFIAWVIASALGATGGILVAMTGAFTPAMGFNTLLIVAAAKIVGGLGNPAGAVVGAFVVGLLMELSTLFMNPALKPVVAFALTALVILLRPNGLMGRPVH